MITYALDFESFYSNECSITTLGPRGYFSHPDFDAYMVTVAGSDGFTYAGHPSGFNWELLNDQRVLSHNASFDESLYLFGVEKEWFPKTTPAEWHCTSDMCSFLGLPRSLKNASAAVLGVTVDKSVRDNMKNKKWAAMTDEFRESVTTYAIGDAELCLKLWDALSEQWPSCEREISRVNREIGRRGLPIDTGLLESNLTTIKTALFNAEQSIPWIGESTALSRKAFNQKCREDGINPPASLAKDNADTEEWFDKNQDQCPWARAVQDFRRINAFLRKLEAFDLGTMSDGRYYGGLMYCGANPTARFSGSGGNLNLQNLPRGDMFGVSFRNMIKPKPGYKLIVADLAQIEVRTLCWLSKDTKALELIRNSEDIYHAFGVLLGMHDPANGQLKQFDPKLRHKVKSMVLGCGYGIGAARFAEFSGMTLPEAEAAVALYRDRMSSVVRYWKSFNEDLSMCVALNQPLELSLPSGRTLRYGRLRRMREAPKKTGDMIRFKYLCKMIRNGAPRDLSLWGGILAENCVAETAEVLTADLGWVPLRSVTSEQKVWDGVEFVNHSGFVSRGEQRVVSVHGVKATPDHQFLFGGEWVAAEIACKLPISEFYSPHEALQRLHRSGVRDMPSVAESHTGTTHHNSSREKSALVAEMPMRKGSGAVVQRVEADKNLRSGVPFVGGLTIESPHDPRTIRTQAVRGVAFYAGQMSVAYSSGMAKLRGAWYQGVRAVACIPELLGRYAAHLGGWTYLGSRGQRWSLLPGELSLGYLQTAGPQYTEKQVPELHTGSVRSKRGETEHALLQGGPRVADGTGGDNPREPKQPVGDILNCGPRNRFAVRASEGSPILIAHNCSQGLARDIFADMMLRVDAAGYPIILHVHDELVCEVPEEQAEQAYSAIMEIMSTPPEWIPDIPLSAEAHILDAYTK